MMVEAWMRDVFEGGGTRAIDDTYAKAREFDTAFAALFEWTNDNAQHPEGCGWYKPTGDTGCDCGLDAALALAEAVRS